MSGTGQWNALNFGRKQYGHKFSDTEFRCRVPDCENRNGSLAPGYCVDHYISDDFSDAMRAARIR